MMTKEEIYNAFNGKISRTAIIDRGGEYVVQGKYCIAAPEEDSIWDVWVCNPKNISAGLSQKRVNSTLSALQGCDKRPIRVLTGEGWVKVAGTEKIIANLAPLGIPRKRKISPEQPEAITRRNTN